MHYYNEFDPRAAAWLRELMAAKLIPEGKIDERDIRDVAGRDLDGFVQCHFFAGIGGWPLALQLAGWPENEPVWTGSCPCQPFSVAGKKRGKRDKRHLWPEFHRLIGERQPAIVFGEQVAGKAGRAWLAGVFADLEGLAYACAGADLCAAGVGEKNHPLIQESVRFLKELEQIAFSGGHNEIGLQLREFADFLAGIIVGPSHIRQRLWWVADVDKPGRWGQREQRESFHADVRNVGGLEKSGRLQRGRRSVVVGEDARAEFDHVASAGIARRLADAAGVRSAEQRVEPGERKGAGPQDAAECDGSGRVVYPALPEGSRQRLQQKHLPGQTTWDNFEIIPCRDGKARRIESGSFPLADGFPGRVGLLRGYGNAIVPSVAAEFIKAFREIGR